MSPAAFIDANAPIYASGREHVHKEPCARVLMMVAEHPAVICDRCRGPSRACASLPCLGAMGLGESVPQPVFQDGVAVVGPLRAGRSRRDIWPLQDLPAQAFEPGKGGLLNDGFGDGGHGVTP